MPLLEVENLQKSFGETQVLSDITFSMERGETVSIIGSSGSGKTTLLRCLNFLETPDAGRIVVGGETLFDGRADDRTPGSGRPLRGDDRELRKKRLHFGLVFQAFHLFPQYTALENVTLAPMLSAKEKKALDAEKRREILAEGASLLDTMGLSDRKDNYPHQLSGGQCQRVAIARALAMKPDILCFDEPTSALDPELTGEVLRVIRELAQKKTTMIIVTHEMAFARDVADTCIFMDRGVIAEMGKAADVIDHPKEERTKQFVSKIGSV